MIAKDTPEEKVENYPEGILVRVFRESMEEFLIESLDGFVENFLKKL